MGNAPVINNHNNIYNHGNNNINHINNHNHNHNDIHNNPVIGIDNNNHNQGVVVNANVGVGADDGCWKASGQFLGDWKRLIYGIAVVITVVIGGTISGLKGIRNYDDDYYPTPTVTMPPRPTPAPAPTFNMAILLPSPTTNSPTPQPTSQFPPNVPCSFPSFVYPCP